VLSNSLGTTAKIAFSAGTKDVFVTYPSDKALLGTTSAVASTGTGSVVLNSNPSFATDITVNGLTVGRGSGNFNSNTVFGNGSLTNNTTGTSNIIIGKNNIASAQIFTTQNNVVISNNLNIDSGTNCIYIGNSATPQQPDPEGEIVIGNTTGFGNNSAVIGNTNTSMTYVKGRFNCDSGATINATTQTINIGTGSVSGALTIGGTSGASSMTFGRSTVSQTTEIQAGATASGSTKTMNIGTGGLAGSTTNIAIGSTAGTSTTTVNGLLKQQTFLVANLPTGSAGSRSFVTDASGVVTALFGTTAVGGGSNGVPVYHDGTSWKVG
jgi:hypothetical protein